MEQPPDEDELDDDVDANRIADALAMQQATRIGISPGAMLAATISRKPEETQPKNKQD